jgi:hypothetical protein
VRVERIEVRDAFVNLADFKLRQIDVDLELTPQGGLARARLRADQDHLNVTMIPKGRSFVLDLTAHDWKMPAGPPLLLSSLRASGTLNPEGLILPSIEARLYGGTISGKLNIGWGAEWTILGDLDVQKVEIQPVVAIYTKGTTISGRLTARPVVNMRAPSAGQLGEAVDVESDFRVENGILYNFDLSKAPKALLSRDALRGGETRFDRFSGHLSVDPSGYYLSKVAIASGVFTADAEVSISSKQELSGQIDVAIKGTSALVSTPLALSGTVQNPALYPSKAALAGAAAGTALLGPGLGTTVGMKAARFTQKIFGRKAPKKTGPGKQEAASEAKEPAPVDQKKQPPPMHSGR